MILGKSGPDVEVLCIGSRLPLLEDTLLGPAAPNPILEGALLGPATPVALPEPLLADSSCPACP